MTTWVDANNALKVAVLAAAKSVKIDAKIEKADIKRPVVRGAFKIDLSSNRGGRLCYGYAERDYDAEIYFYPKAGAKELDDRMTMADALSEVFLGGVFVAGIWVALDEGISCDVIDGVLVCKLTLSWVEQIPEALLPHEGSDEFLSELDFNFDKED